MRSPGLLIAAALILMSGAAFSGCAAPRQKDTPPTTFSRPLPTPPSGELQFAGNPPAHPFEKQEGGHYARTVFETDGPGNSHIEVREVLIPPHAKATVAALPGSAIIDPGGTTGVTLATGDKPMALADGAMRSLPAGQALAFENSDANPATVKLYIIRSR